MRFLRVGEPGAERPAVEERRAGLRHQRGDPGPRRRASSPPAASGVSGRPSPRASCPARTSQAGGSGRPSRGRPPSCASGRTTRRTPRSPAPRRPRPDHLLQAPEHRRRPVRRRRWSRAAAQKTDWEVELGVVIGRRARYLASPDEARGRHRRLRRLARRLRARVPDRGLRRPVVQGQVLRDVQPARPVAGDRRRGRRPADARLRSLGQRRAAAGLHHRRHDLHVADLVWHLRQYMVLDRAT